MEVLGKEHSETTMTYDNLASYYAVVEEYDNADMKVSKTNKQRDEKRANECYKKALDIFIYNFGSEHPHTQRVL